MAVAGITPTVSQLTKICKMQSGGCWLCRIVRHVRGESTDSLAVKPYGHINSSGYEGMATTVTAAHHSIFKHLYDSMHAAQKSKRKLKFVTLDKESNMSTLRRREEFRRICSKEYLVTMAQKIEVTMPVKKSQQTRYNFEPVTVVVNRFWGRRPDGVAINRWGSADRILLRISTVNRQGRGVSRGERSRSKCAAQKHHQCTQSSCSEV